MNFTEGKRKQMDYICLMLMIIILWFFGARVTTVGLGYLSGTGVLILIIWALVGAGSTDSIGKMIRSRKSRGQYRNVQKLSNNLIIFQGSLGILGSAALLIFARPLAENVIKIPLCTLLIQLASPYIFLHSCVCTLKGVLQGESEETSVVVADWIKVITFFLFALVFEKALKGYGDKVSALLGQEHFSYMYGGAGVVIGFLISELLVLLFLGFACSKHLLKKKHSDGDGKKVTESFWTHVRNMLVGRVMNGLLLILELIPFLIVNIMALKASASIDAGTALLGEFVGNVVLLVAMVSIPSFAMIFQMFSKIAVSMRRAERRVARNHFQCGFHFCFSHGVLAGFFACAMGNVFCDLFQTKDASLQKLYFLAGIFVLVVVVYYFLSRLMMRLGWQMIVLAGAIVGNVMFAFLFIVLSKGLSPYQAFAISLLISMILFSVVMGAFAFSQFRVGTDAFAQILVSTGAAGVIGLIDFLIQKLLAPGIGGVTAILIAFVFSVPAFWLALILSRNIKEYELGIAPGGKLLKNIGEFLRVF